MTNDTITDKYGGTWTPATASEMVCEFLGELKPDYNMDLREEFLRIMETSSMERYLRGTALHLDNTFEELNQVTVAKGKGTTVGWMGIDRAWKDHLKSYYHYDPGTKQGIYDELKKLKEEL